MSEIIIALSSAFWLGILTSISPCPLATNIAAVSFVGRNIEKARKVALSGFLYSLGRMCAYTLTGSLVILGLSEISSLSFLLQRIMNMALGPILVLVGMFLVGLIKLNFLSFGVSTGIEKWSKKSGLLSSFSLGLIFALSFCPVSAALFFGGLIPIAIKIKSNILAPALFGLGTAFPVIIFGLFLTVGRMSADKLFKKITHIQKQASLVSGIIILVVGLYLSLTNTFQLF